MIFDDDFIQYTVDGALFRFPCKSLGIHSWPPPEYIELKGIVYQRLRYSSITNSQRAKMMHVCRGAEYAIWAPEGTLH